MQTGRNDPCPCGSGKKFKKCCLATAESHDHEYRRWLNIERTLIPRLTAHAFSIHDRETFEDAWYEFNCTDEGEMIQPDSDMNMVFMPWFLFTWAYEVDAEDPDDFDLMTNAESFRDTYESELSADELSYLESAITAIYSLCEVRGLKPGEGMTLRDLFTGDEYFVQERLASQSLSRGEIIYCTTIELGGFKTNLATAPFALRPTTKRDVLQLRQEIMEEVSAASFRDIELIAYEEAIRSFYLNRVDGMFRPPTLTNTDGDPILFHKLHFDLRSVHEAFHLLKDLSGVSEEKVLKTATIEDGQITAVEIDWLSDTKDDVLFGVLILTQGELVVEVNSEERASLARGIIEERLGELVTYRTSSIISLDDEIERQWQLSLAEAAREESAGRGVDTVVGPDVEFDSHEFQRDALTGDELGDDELDDDELDDDELDDDEFDEDEVDAEEFEDSDFDEDELGENELSGDDSESVPDSTGFEPNFSTLDLNDPEIQELMNRGVGAAGGELDPDDPQIQEMLKIAAAKHWSTWFDIPVPALNEMTPREASRTEYGRDLLESLLLEYEMNIRRYPSNASKPDIEHLRRELGMD